MAPKRFVADTDDNVRDVVVAGGVVLELLARRGLLRRARRPLARQNLPAARVGYATCARRPGR
jgi:hypothetical protein